MDKLQLLVLIFALLFAVLLCFAVLLSKLCNLSLCNLQNIFQQFFDSLDGSDLPYKIVKN